MPTKPPLLHWTAAVAIYIAPYACVGHKSPELARDGLAHEFPARVDAGHPLRHRHASGSHKTDEPKHQHDADQHTQAATQGRRAGALAVQSRLARAALAEARWSRTDRAIMFHVLARWSRRMGCSLETAIALRVERFSRRPPRWIAHVEPSCSEPTGWPKHLAWGEHHDRCLALYADASAFLSGELPDLCPAAQGWRAPGVATADALANGRRRVCRNVRTANTFVAAR